MYRYLLANGENLLVENANDIIAYVGAFTHRAWRAGHIVTLNVHPDARRAGLGARLLAAMEARLQAAGMRRVLLEVNVANAPAIALYERAGFGRVRRIENYYESGYADPDAFAYAKELDEKRGAPEGVPPGQPRSHG